MLRASCGGTEQERDRARGIELAMSGVNLLDAGRVASAGGRGVFTGFTADGWVECSGRGENGKARGGQSGREMRMMSVRGGGQEQGRKEEAGGRVAATVVVVVVALMVAAEGRGEEEEGDRGCKAHLVQSPLPVPYVPAGQRPQVVLSGERPVPATPTQHSPLSQVIVQAEAPVTRCVAASQLLLKGEGRKWVKVQRQSRNGSK